MACRKSEPKETLTLSNRKETQGGILHPADTMKKEFNLLDEKWIHVLMPDLTGEDVSLTEALANGEAYYRIAVETGVQDVAVFRLLLAVSHSIFYRFAVDGTEKRIESTNDAITRWKDYRELGHFPSGSVETYLNRYRERFWLFHPDCPFYQSNVAKKGTHFGAAKLTLMESNNKPRWFASRAGDGKNIISYAEAARCLLFINGYDDAAVKPSVRGLPAIGMGWIGRLTTVEIIGKNLFDTLMLNLVPLQENGKLWSKPLPMWECAPRSEERIEVEQPSNPAEMLTFQSRRLLLERNDGKAVGFFNLGGECFNKENAFAETMTLWTSVDKTENYQPARMFDDVTEISVWQLLEKILGEKTAPKSIQWLRKMEVDQAYLNVAAIIYNLKANNVVGDYHKSIRVKIDPISAKTIIDEVKACKLVVKAITALEYDIQKAAGSAAPDGRDATIAFLDRIDYEWPKFSENPNSAEIERFHELIKKKALMFAKDLVTRAPLAALTGRSIINKDGEKKYYSSAKALNWFEYKLSQIYPVPEQKSSNEE